MIIIFSAVEKDVMVKRILLLIVSLIGLFPFNNQAKQFRGIQDQVGIVATACENDAVIINSGGWKLRASDFISKGYRPIRISIENKCENLVTVSDDSVQGGGVSIVQLTEKFKHNTLETTIISWLLLNIMMVYMKTSAASWWGVNIALFLGYYQWQKQNKALYAALSSGLGEGYMIIRQGAQVERIFLVPTGQRGAFTFSIFGEDNKNVISKFYIECT
jgi:hypothetical protein